MTTGRTRAVLATALLLLGGAPALAGQTDDRAAKNDIRDAEDVREESDARFLVESARAPRPAAGAVVRSAAAAAQGFSASPGMRAELFGRGALALLNVSAEDTFALSAGPNTEGETLTASRLASEAGWGGGFRLMSADWGVEGTYTLLESLALSPTWLVADDMGASGGPGLLDLPFVASRAGVMLGQVVRNFRLSGGGAEIFVGLGVGWMRVTDSSTDRLLAGTAVQDARDQFLQDLPPDLPAEFVPEVEFTADRSTVAYAGSLGVAFRVGRVLLRPRADLIVSPALTTDLTVRFADLGAPLLEELGSFEVGYATSVKPTIFLISLDIGLGN